MKTSARHEQRSAAAEWVRTRRAPPAQPPLAVPGVLARVGSFVEGHIASMFAFALVLAYLAGALTGLCLRSAP